MIHSRCCRYSPPKLWPTKYSICEIPYFDYGIIYFIYEIKSSMSTIPMLDFSANLHQNKRVLRFQTFLQSMKGVSNILKSIWLSWVRTTILINYMYHNKFNLNLLSNLWGGMMPNAPEWRFIHNLCSLNTSVFRYDNLRKILYSTYLRYDLTI